MENSNTLSIYFGNKCANLYTIGFVSSEIVQLLTFCELIQLQKKEELEYFFYKDNYKSYPFRRNSKIITDNIKITQINDVKKGSVDLLAAAGLAANIIMPIVSVFIQRYLYNRDNRQHDNEINRDDREIFNINPFDQVLNNQLNAFSLGLYGEGANGLNKLFNALSELGYNVEALNVNVFNIYHVTDIYAQRIAKIIQRNL